MKLLLLEKTQTAKKVAEIDILEAKHHPKKTNVRIDLEEALLFAEYSLENELELAI